MVSEDTFKTSSVICNEQGFKTWLSHQIKTMPDAPANSDKISNENKLFIKKLVDDICDSALEAVMECEKRQVIARDTKLTKEEQIQRNINRKTSLVCSDEAEPFPSNPCGEGFEPFPLEFNNNYVNLSVLKRSVSERVFTRNHQVQKPIEPVQIRVTVAPVDNTQKEKKKKKLTFSNLFHKKDKHKTKENPKHDEDGEVLDNLPQLPNFRPTLGMSKKYASAVELSQKPAVNKLHRSPSFIQKLVHISEDSSNFLRRSLSFRDVRKKDKVPLRENLTEIKKQEWRQSLQSLVESDTSVSYKDLSFIDYDALNQFTYDDGVFLKPGFAGDNNSYVTRSQSMKEKRSSQLGRPQYRVTSATEYNPQYRSTLSLTENTGTFSLPSLYHHPQEDAEGSSESISRSSKLHRRPQSICSEDGVRSNGSFRSTGSASSKLKRHNACRQKVRHPATFIETRQKDERDTAVRSRSLNHLDSLDMRQSVVSTAEAALKDSRSEPDCTRPLLAPTVATKDSEGATVVSSTEEVPPARKYMLSRSQKSSSECFSVNFEVGDESTWDNELFFPAQRGITLHDSLAKLCELRNIDLSACEARLQDKENNSESLLLFSQDSANLVGRHVRITAKDTSNKKLSGSFYGNHSRKQSGSYRPRTSSFFSSSTEDQTVGNSNLSLHDGDQSKKQIKQRLTAFFGNSKDTKYEALIEQLDRYSRQGIPQNVNYPQGQCESIDALYKLEDDWRDIIDCSELADKQQQQQTALWELIKTEVAYIKTLKVVTDLFLACLRDLQSRTLLKEIDTDKLFSNVSEILDSNVIFWRNTLFPLVRDMRKHKRASCIENMVEGFFKIHDTFQPYYKYCAEQSRCQHYCRENLDSEVFTAYLTWCESQKDCNRLRLMDILVQPMQRLTKYGLLLKAILKNTDEDVERESLQSMIRMVDEFVNNVNSSLKHRQDKERLKGIIARIESYDIVESKDDDIERILKKDKALTQLDLTRPMLGCPQERKRHLLLEGDLKMKDTGASKMEVHCFLLTDMLLICKPSTKKGGATMRVIRQPYLVDRLVVQELNRETPSLALIYRNEFDMAIAAFILQSSDAKKIKGWKEGIAKAQSLYAQAKQMSYVADESLDTEYGLDYNLESDYHSLQLAPRSPHASSSRASRVSSLAHSHSGSVEMNDQSSIGSIKDQSRGVSVENDNRTGSISSDEGVQPLPPDKTTSVSQKNSLKNRLFPKTPNTLSVQPYGNLGQSLPNLTLGSPNVGSLSLCLNQNTLSVPSNKNGGHLLSPTHRGISYPPPSPTRGNLRRSLAISQNKNPPLMKTRQVNSASSVSSNQLPASLDFDVPVIAGVCHPEEGCESFSRGQHRQAMKRSHRYHTAGVVDEIKKNGSRDANIYKRLSWNCTSQDQRPPTEDQT